MHGIAPPMKFIGSTTLMWGVCLTCLAGTLFYLGATFSVQFSWPGGCCKLFIVCSNILSCNTQGTGPQQCIAKHPKWPAVQYLHHWHQDHHGAEKQLKSQQSSFFDLWSNLDIAKTNTSRIPHRAMHFYFLTIKMILPPVLELCCNWNVRATSSEIPQLYVCIVCFLQIGK